jgi:hypothetical protein
MVCGSRRGRAAGQYAHLEPPSSPVAGVFVGILAALGTIGSALLFLAVIILIGVVIVFVLRRRK